MVIIFINKLLYYGLFIVSIYFFVFPYKFGYMWTFFLISFFVAWLASKFIDKYRLNQNFKILANIALWLGLFGELYLFYYLQYYDKILHFVIPLFITACAYDFFKKHLKINKTVIFLSVLGGCVLFEIYEYFLQIFFNLPLMGVWSNNGDLIMSPLNDTIIDLVIDMFGSITYLIFKRK